MRYGIYLPTRGPLAEPDAIAAIARGAESMGYATIVVADHIVFPVRVESKYPYTITRSARHPRRPCPPPSFSGCSSG